VSVAGGTDLQELEVRRLRVPPVTSSAMTCCQQHATKICPPATYRLQYKPDSPYIPLRTSFSRLTMAAEKADSAHTPDPEIPKDLSDEERLKQAAAAAEKALEAQGMANKLRETAATFTDPKKREKMLRDAYNKELEAHGSSKKARVLQSGAFQGSIGGAGIGGAVSAGVGTLVGTVVGGVTAIPVTGLGALAGAGVGAVHGPWIKLGKLAQGGKADDKKDGDKDGEKQEDISPDDDDVVPNPDVLRKSADALSKERAKKGEDAAAPAKKGDAADKSAKKKPRKLEVRSGAQKQKQASS
jgi:hypothetical protein